MSAGNTRRGGKPTLPVGLAAAVFFVGSHPLWAATPRRALFDLVWSAPPGCPDESHVRDTIEHLAGPGDTVAETPLLARATATRGTDGLWRLHLETERSGSHGERDITGESCEALAGSAAVILALVLNPSADLTAFNPSELEGSSGSGSKSATADRPSEVPLGNSPVAAPPMDTAHDGLASKRRARWLVGASGAIDQGALPEPAWGVSGLVGGRFGRARIEAAFTWWSPQHRLASPNQLAGGDFSFVTGSAIGCYDFPVGRVVVGPCGGLELGAMRAKAFGVRAPGDATELWAAGLVGGGALVELTPGLAIELGIFVGFPLRRPDFFLEGVGSVHQPMLVLGRGILGPRLQF